MKPLPESWPRLRDSQDEDTIALGKVHSARLHQWARGSETEIRHAFRNYRRPHRRFRARRAQIWGPLYAIALEAGEDWPDRCIAAFKAMALDASDVPVLSPGQMILRDAAACFDKSGADRLFAADIAKHLRSIPDVELYEDLTDRGLAQTDDRSPRAESGHDHRRRQGAWLPREAGPGLMGAHRSSARAAR